MATTFDSWKAKEPKVYEESPPPVNPRDEAYTEACEEIAKLRQTIESWQRETRSCIRGKYQMLLVEHDLAIDCSDHHRADTLHGFLMGFPFSLGVSGDPEELPKSRHTEA